MRSVTDAHAPSYGYCVDTPSLNPDHALFFGACLLEGEFDFPQFCNSRIATPCRRSSANKLRFYTVHAFVMAEITQEPVKRPQLEVNTYYTSRNVS